MSNRDVLRDIFLDTQQYIANNEELKTIVNKSVAGTFLSDSIPPIPNSTKHCNSGDISVINGRTLVVAREYTNTGRTAVLNFASAVNPGGKCMDGSSAQEESLCRVSTLYNSLNTEFNHTMYYNYHRKLGSKMYTNKIIYTPDVCVFKKDDVFPKEILPREEWYMVDVITCAAPNLIHLGIDTTDEYCWLLDILKTRTRHILHIAEYYNVDNIILGAFGCGVFKNPPELVAKAFQWSLADDIKYSFENIVFAVINDYRGKSNFEAFNRIFGR